MDGPGSIDDLDPRAAAGARVRAFGTRLEHIGLDDFRQIAMSPTAADDRASARAEVIDAIESAGLAELAATTRADVRAYMDRVYAGGVYRPTWVALNWGLSTGSVQDRLGTIAVVEDAALATIADGLAPQDAVDALRAPFELIAEAHPMPHGGDALPTVDDVRRVGPWWGLVAVLLIGLALVGWVGGGWWPILGLVAVVGVVAWLRGGRPRPTDEP
jgi:hypothetical protein